MKLSFLRVAGIVLTLAIVALCGCATASNSHAVPPLILISLDAFRWDYCAKYPAETPHLRELMREGISAKGLIPVYPSNTFPNHYSIVTGLYPSHHGIVNNNFFDPARGEFFRYNNPPIAQRSYWWGGEPIWVTAIKQGRKSAASYWVGSEAEIAGVRPSFYRLYNTTTPFQERLDELFKWLHLPAAERPAVITFYFEETNSKGHKFGPDSPELAAAVKLVDAQVGAIVAQLKKEKLAANFVIVSDHGMTPISKDRIMFLDDYIDFQKVQVDFDEPVAGLRPMPGTEINVVMQSLARLPHAKAYRVEDLPAHFHIGGNPRNPPIWIVPEEGWEIESREKFSRYATFNKGDHGFDPAFTSMRGILIAQGPSFRSGGGVIEPVENVHIYNLLCAALGLKPAPNDGDDRLVKAMLRR
jgi:predicted AlkP superfamily pyrophosphatase or phosphodiesterase